ncbi:MAG: aminotransferase class I/II-fold pyridoxal phosphate-dependent enzyme [Candidatus Omnitrophica bacterium]|jgi:aminotransferase|nr:aminotransferase class I/II-fold pyridoxal phosphate-dependent enzyme [Candidatus Omnitrophota bacterium]MDD5253401.1 aminotransferase class I/II-fold pyridoxal phosphate-dependent enzyme [Candidatus Omnitrophota bacterium]
MEISKVVEKMQPSGIRAFFDLVLGMKDVISLGVGEPDFVTPWQIREAGIYSLEQGFTSYTSNKGLYKLRLGLHRYLKNKFGLDYCPDEEILITVGVSEGIDLVLRALINPGDKVLVPVPSYVSYGPVTELAGGVPVYIDTSKDGFKVTPELIKKHIDKKVKAIVLNYPTNPTGVSYRRRELEEINKVLLKHKILCISDEVYGDLTYDFGHTAFPSLPGAKKNTVYFNGFSKSFAMTGWRVGYVCGPKEIIAAMTKIHQYTIMCVPITSQMAAAEALASGKRSVEQMKREYDRRRQLMTTELNSLGLKCSRPQGAFYIFPSIKCTGLSSMDFSRKLLEEEKVAVVPGTAFGSCSEGYIRISYASSFENLKEALSRIKSFLEKRTPRA